VIGVLLPHRNQIDRAQVLAAALRIAERTGPDAVSMRGVAAELGVAPMSLYHHVRNRGELLAGMVDQMIGEAPELEGDGTPWRTRLRSLFLALRFLAHTRPRTFPLALRHPDAPELVRLRMVGADAVAEAMAEAGVPRDQLQPTEAVVWTLVLGFVTREALGQFRGPSTGGADRIASAVLAAVEHHIDRVAADPARAHPEDPACAGFASDDDW